MNTPRRRWFQFSLRTLLVLMVIVSLGMGWVIKERRRVAVRREALIDAGVEWDVSDGQPAWHRMLYGKDEPSFMWLIEGDNFTDAGLVHVTGLTQLRGLWLSNTQISDAGLVHLTGLTQLQDLGLDKTQITDAGLTLLKGLPQLEGLRLSNTKATDAGLVYLTGLTQLKHLWLSITEITDAGLVHLTGLTQLQVLGLKNTRITDAGVSTLGKALPNCNIIR